MKARSPFFNALLLSLVLILPGWVFAQSATRKVIQFSGVIVSSDSLKPVPYAAISVKGSYRGTLSDYYGFFSFVAQEGDTIEFSALGFSRAHYTIPDKLEDTRYSIIQVLQTDTVLLPTTVVYAWPTREQIYEYFLTAPVPDDDLERARKNLSQEKMAEISMQMPSDPSSSYRHSMNQFNTRLYNAGQIPQNNLLNPIAWAKFVEAWKRGDFKKKK